MRQKTNDRPEVLRRLFEHMDGKVSGVDALTWLAPVPWGPRVATRALFA